MNPHFDWPPTWPSSVKDCYVERIAILREANHVPEDLETPLDLVVIATEEALSELQAFIIYRDHPEWEGKTLCEVFEEEARRKKKNKATD